jgi:hypothetical protein
LARGVDDALNDADHPKQRCGKTGDNEDENYYRDGGY